MTYRLLAVCPLALLVACGSDSKGNTGHGPGGAPTATASATPLIGDAPLVVQLNCDVAGGDSPLTFAWDFGDGTSDTFQRGGHTYTTPGNYTATCEVTDADGYVLVFYQLRHE